MVGARRELGDEMEPAVVDAFLDRVEAAIEQRAAEGRAPQEKTPGHGETLALAIVSLGTGIPITAIAAENGGALGVVAAWAGIAGINIAFSRQRRD